GVVDMFAWLLAATFIGGLLYLLWNILRWSVVSPFLTRGASERLRQPKTSGIEALVGFPAPVSLIEFYTSWPHLEKVEYYLVNSSTDQNWFIGGFEPLSRMDAHEIIRSTLAPGIPIANDMDKGVYFLNAQGAVELSSPNVPTGRVLVAGS